MLSHIIIVLCTYRFVHQICDWTLENQSDVTLANTVSRNNYPYQVQIFTLICYYIAVPDSGGGSWKMLGGGAQDHGSVTTCQHAYTANSKV